MTLLYTSIRGALDEYTSESIGRRRLCILFANRRAPRRRTYVCDYHAARAKREKGREILLSAVRGRTRADERFTSGEKKFSCPSLPPLVHPPRVLAPCRRLDTTGQTSCRRRRSCLRLLRVPDGARRPLKVTVRYHHDRYAARHNNTRTYTGVTHDNNTTARLRSESHVTLTRRFVGVTVFLLSVHGISVLGTY